MRQIADLKVIVNVELAIDALKKNQEAHRRQHESAHAIWRTDVSVELGRMRDRFEQENKPFDFEALSILRHEEPRSYAREYSSALSTLRNCSTDTIELPGYLVGAFFEDEWEWKEHYFASTAKYLNR